MPRTANSERPEELLDAIVDYLASKGMADMSLRPIARAVGSSPRGLLYYFGSREELIVRVLGRLRERQRAAYGEMGSAADKTPREVCKAIWRHMSAPKSEPMFRMFFEAYSMAMQNPARFSSFLKTAVEDWLTFLAAPRIARGESRAAARAVATLILAGFRGFMLDYCASHDRKRIDAAVELWLDALDAMPIAPLE